MVTVDCTGGTCPSSYTVNGMPDPGMLNRRNRASKNNAGITAATTVITATTSVMVSTDMAVRVTTDITHY